MPPYDTIELVHKNKMATQRGKNIQSNKGRVTFGKLPHLLNKGATLAKLS